MNTGIVNVLDGTQAEAVEQAAEAIIEGSRYGDRAQQVLARYEQVDSLMPSPDELRGQGFDVAAIARALVLSKLNPVLFGRALDAGLTPEGFRELLDSVTADELSGVLTNYIEAAQEHRQHPDPSERAMHRLHECGCCG